MREGGVGVGDEGGGENSMTTEQTSSIRAPDKQKLLAYAAAIRSLHAETMTTEAGKVLARRTMNELCLVAGKLEQQAEAM